MLDNINFILGLLFGAGLGAAICWLVMSLKNPVKCAQDLKVVVNDDITQIDSFGIKINGVHTVCPDNFPALKSKFKPKPTLEELGIKDPWIDEDTKYIAFNNNGFAYGFKDKPKCESIWWLSKLSTAVSKGYIDSFESLGYDWKELIYERPGTKFKNKPTLEQLGIKDPWRNRWTAYIAVDSDGTVFPYRGLPIIHDNNGDWFCGASLEPLMGIPDFKSLGYDWKELIYERPKKIT